MFESYSALKEKEKADRYRRRLERNMDVISPKLKRLIDLALEDIHATPPVLEGYEYLKAKFFGTIKLIPESFWFNPLVVVSILVVGLFVGIDTDVAMQCARAEGRTEGRDDDHVEKQHFNCDVRMSETIISIVAQLVFTFEAAVKILAEDEPKNYFMSRADGSWNCLDFFIVIVGFVEMTPLSQELKAFPVVILRLMRVLRVFRLAKALPRLRSVVEALFSGLSAVGWICILIIAYNYIVACGAMILFQHSDPFHFGSVGKAMFSVLRIETLDSWDQMLFVNMFGCDQFPAAYPFTVEDRFPGTQCNDPYAYGWWGALAIFAIVITGSYVMPVCLIGIIAISYDDAKRQGGILKDLDLGMKDTILQAKQSLPGFFAGNRIDLIRKVFEEMDADDELTLDLNEMAPFYHYVFNRTFDISLEKEQTEALFHLMDTDGMLFLASCCFIVQPCVTSHRELCTLLRPLGRRLRTRFQRVCHIHFCYQAA